MGKGWTTFQARNLKCNVGCPLANPLASLPVGIFHVVLAHLFGSTSPCSFLASYSDSPALYQWRTHFYFSICICLNILCVLGLLQSLDLSSPFTSLPKRISIPAERYLNSPYYPCKMPNAQTSNGGA
ncbi:unnamed protein product [Rangifer tarandus platyrhynchus]|uniref:Uncharacterized protein n=1 Tax=Rangifer tarandus platyrhynchus TaxID=3082113 RepID=A0AC59Z3S8_RANTA